MKIEIDKTEIELFTGAQVRDALLKYSRQAYNDVRSGKKQVLDKWDNPMEPGGQLSGGETLRLENVRNQPGGIL
ncbi:MAG: hypothetical protein GY940_05050 [bacterium]|nr:hypothetical protein [bacterium]